MSLAPLTAFWNLVRRVDKAFEVQQHHAKSIERLEARIAALEERVTRLELRDEVIAARAESAAMTGASLALGDIARRVGVPEERSRGTGMLPPPG